MSGRDFPSRRPSADLTAEERAVEARDGGTRPVELAADRFTAMVFDMDGVVTDTAAVHAAAWKELFDDLLHRRAEGGGEPFVPFDADGDYRRFVDGRARQDGVAGFLAARGIRLPLGEPAAPPGEGTVWALANRKNALFLARVAAEGVTAFPSTVQLLRRLREAGLRTAVVTASRNSREILAAAGVDELFDVRVDGMEAQRLDLPGKPDPATFLEAARRLGVPPARAVVVEDALAGVEAGRRGGFGLVVGVDRAGHGAELAAHGADVVVTDLAELRIHPPRPAAEAAPPPGFCGGGQARGGWVLAYEGFDPAREGLREALCTIGNGYLATRGAAPEARADAVHYPGTYLAGVYNRLTSQVHGRTVEDEHLVNAPNWLPLQFRVEDGPWFAPATTDLLAYDQELDLRCGLLTRDVRFRDPAGRVTRVQQRRLVHMGQRHLAALETTFLAENWAGRLQVRSAIDGRVVNGNVTEYHLLANRHLVPSGAGATGEDTVTLEATTSQSRILIAVAARTRVHASAHPDAVTARRLLTGDAGYVGHDLDLTVRQGEPVTVEKVAALVTSKDPAVSEPGLAARTAVGRAGRFDALLADSAEAWQRLWDRFAVAMDAGEHATLALNLHVFHLLQTLSPHTIGLDAGVPARGLHGEGYRGHVFWDELFVFPLLNLRLPGLTRSLLLYRYRRLDEARWAARTAGHDGAMFPWQSGSEGREETPTQLYNPRSRRWMPDNSRLQRHVGIAVAYNVWQYHQVTADVEFLADYGAEMIVEVARFFASLAAYDPADDRYGIAGVMGPDEFHDGYPDAAERGLRDNAYTNVMAVWVICRALDVVALLAGHHCGELWHRLRLRPEELERWEHISRRMRVPFHDDVVSQFAGYERLAEFDWDGYRARYGNIGRLDLILEGEGDTPNRYRVSKQADVLMLLYLLSAEELRGLFERLGYNLDGETITRTVEFYRARVAHGSTLSRVVHAWVLSRADRERSWSLLAEALDADLADTQGGTTREGIHLGAMAGTADLVLRCYSGLETRGDVLWLHPRLPANVGMLHLEVLYRGQWVVIDVDQRRLRVSLRPCAAAPIQVGVDGAAYTLHAGQSHEFSLSD